MSLIIVIFPACSAEKKSPLLSTEAWLEAQATERSAVGALRFFVGGRAEGPLLEPPGPDGGWTPLMRAGRDGVCLLYTSPSPRD